MLWICLKEDVCLYRPNARWGEFEWPKTLKDHSWRIAEKVWVSGSENLLKNYQTAPTSPRCLEGLQEKKNQEKKMLSLFHQKTISSIYSVIRHNWNFKWDLASMVRCNYKMSFLAAITQDGFGEHKDKKYPMCTMNILLYFWCCGPIFLLEVLDILFRQMASWILLNTNR